MLISLVSVLFSISEKGFLVCGIFLRKSGTFRLLARRLLISTISAPQLASFFNKIAHHNDHRSHLTGFCSFDHDFISPRSFTRSCIGNFSPMGLS